MEIARRGGPKEDHALDVRSAGFTYAPDKLVNRILWNHCILALPTAAGTTPAGTASAEPTKPTAAAEASSTATSAPGPTAAAKPAATTHIREENPEQNAAQRRGHDDQENDDQ